ncbi:MAG: family 1 glycosylhydrolase [Candidatus Thorarchaeota archaeon]|nr:family 1 glycosylhydrolase [Candidatus Thorarchaeota archaeon]
MTYHRLTFPKDFKWGSAASAHQTEGGNHNDWSEWEKVPGKIRDKSSSVVACEHYKRYREDFDLAKKYGHQVHRFSVEWSRIEPQRGAWNQREIDHYRDVVKSLVDRGIEPMVTLHHFTNPIWFRDSDGWLNPKSPLVFAPYCRKVAEALCDYDITWNTINEPMVLVAMGYLYGEFPPGHRDYGMAMIAARHLAMAHGQAALQIREVYAERGLDQPRIAPVLSVSHFMPADENNQEDVDLARYLDNLYNHMWIQGVVEARIPDFQKPFEDWEHYEPLVDSADFIGLNYYSRMRVSSRLDFLAGEMPPKEPGLERCEGLDWEVYPLGYYHEINSFWKRYRRPIFLTENGIGTQDDRLRCKYILSHLQQVHRSISEGANVLGYLVWSLTYNFEWAHGYSSHFGLIEVDYKTQERRPRRSASVFRDIIRSNTISEEMQAKYIG